MEYPKINSLWKRQGWYFDQDKKKNPEYQQGRQSFIIGDYAEEEFGNIKKWHVSEKVDGMNIRIYFDCYQKGCESKIKFMGRTKDAMIPPALLEHLQSTFTHDSMTKVFEPKEDQNGFYPSVVLYGEGYGPKIQGCGENYRADVGFILFDVKVNEWWLKPLDVQKIADSFDIDMVPPLGIMEEQQILEFVKSKPLSLCSRNPQMMEGIVARSAPLMLFRRGNPIMFKLKCKEFN